MERGQGWTFLISLAFAYRIEILVIASKRWSSQFCTMWDLERKLAVFHFTPTLFSLSPLQSNVSGMFRTISPGACINPWGYVAAITPFVLHTWSLLKHTSVHSVLEPTTTPWWGSWCRGARWTCWTSGPASRRSTGRLCTPLSRYRATQTQKNQQVLIINMHTLPKTLPLWRRRHTLSGSALTDGRLLTYLEMPCSVRWGCLPAFHAGAGVN